MTNARSYTFSLLWLCVLALLLVGCGETEDVSDLGDWTLEEDGLTLTEDLRVSETENYYFGSIAGRRVPSQGPGLNVTSDGRMVVADGEAHHLKVLRPDGSLIDTLGRHGEGPGEFQILRSVQVVRGDSIYAYGRRRLTVFAPAPPHEVVRTITLETDRSSPFRALIVQTGGVVLFDHPMTAGRDVDDPIRVPWRRFDETGTPGDTVITVRQRRTASVQIGDQMVFRMFPIPFESSTPVAVGPEGRLYVGRTDSLHVSAHDAGGGSTVIASIPAPPVPVRPAERDSILEDIDERAVREQVSSAMPDTKPAMTDLVVADDGLLWVQRPADGPDAETVPWWVLDPETKTIREVDLPPEVNIEVVQDGKAYGTTTTRAGAPAVIRYEIRTES